MKNFKNLEERIIKFKRISSDGEEVNREAEIRRMISEGGEPRSITVRLPNASASPVSIITKFNFDMATQTFKGELSDYTWISDFDWKQYMRLNDFGTTDSYIKSPKSWRS